MILPTKHISVERSLLGLGSIILQHLDRPRTITALWERTHKIPEVATFERFILTIDFLYMIGVVTVSDGLLRKHVL